MIEAFKRPAACLLCLILFCSAFCLAEIQPLTGEDFYITVGDLTCRLGEDAEPLIKAVEKAFGIQMEMTETESCMFDGMDREYACESLLIGTHPGKGRDVLESLLVFDDSLSTARGIAVGMTQADVLSAYGDNGVWDWDEMRYTDPKTGASIAFVFDPVENIVTCWMLLLNTDQP